MATVLETVQAQPGLGSTTQAQLDAYLPEARSLFSVSYVGSTANHTIALALYCCHYLTKDGATGSGASTPGAVTSATIGPSSRSYADVASAAASLGLDSDFATTSFGRRLVRLLGSRSAALPVAVY